MKRTLIWAAMIWALAGGVANALVLQVKPDGDKGDVILRVGMSMEDYKAAAALMGGQNEVTDSSIPGMNDINVAIPVPAARYAQMRKNAAVDSATAGKKWCVTCANGGAKFTVKSEHAFGAAMLGTTQCLDKSKSQDLQVVSGGCDMDGN